MKFNSRETYSFWPTGKFENETRQLRNSIPARFNSFKVSKFLGRPVSLKVDRNLNLAILAELNEMILPVEIFELVTALEELIYLNSDSHSPKKFVLFASMKVL